MAQPGTKPKSGVLLGRRRRVQTLQAAWIPDIIQQLNLVCAAYKDASELEDELVVTVTTDPADKQYPLGFKDQAGLPLSGGKLLLDPIHSIIYKMDKQTGHFTIFPFDEFLRSLITKDNIDEIEFDGRGTVWTIDAELVGLGGTIAA